MMSPHFAESPIKTTRFDSIRPDFTKKRRRECEIARSATTATVTATNCNKSVAREYSAESFKRNIVDNKSENAKAIDPTPPNKNLYCCCNRTAANCREASEISTLAE